MRAFSWLLVTATLAAGLSPGLLMGQLTRDAMVLPFGTTRAWFEGTYAGASLTFPTAAGGSLGPSRFAPLAPVAADLQQLLGTDARVDDETLTLGVPDVRVYDNRSSAVAGLAIGLLPRLEFGVQLPVVRGERLVERLALGGGTVGRNPDPAANARILQALGAEALGRAALLPTDSSALGRALQARVEAATGQTLNLPDAAASGELFNQLLRSEYGLAPLQSGYEEWRVGDVEVSARALLFSSWGGVADPPDSLRSGLRSTVSVSLRLPTGQRPDSVALIPLYADEGRGGYGLHLVTDAVLTQRLWGTLEVGYRSLGPVDVLRRPVDADNPLAEAALPATVTLDPTRELAVRLSPRVRLVEALSVGANYTYLQVGSTTFAPPGGTAGAALIEQHGGGVQQVGLMARYSTLAAHARGEAGVPGEAVVGWQRTLQAPRGLPRTGSITTRVSLFPRLWGRR